MQQRFTKEELQQRFAARLGTTPEHQQHRATMQKFTSLRASYLVAEAAGTADEFQKSGITFWGDAIRWHQDTWEARRQQEQRA
jgi:hypothetical protein